MLDVGQQIEIQIISGKWKSFWMSGEIYNIAENNIRKNKVVYKLPYL